MAEKRFSKAKAAGLKSSLVTDNSVYMTTFGKHNEAILEKKIEDGRITNINNPEKLAVRIINNPKMSVSGLKVMDAVTDNPLSKKAKNKTGYSDKLRSSRYIVGMDQSLRRSISARSLTMKISMFRLPTTFSISRRFCRFT